MLPPEIEEGNNEYKCYFKDIKKDRFVGLSTQMNWRLNEGNGLCYYYIGVNDNGTIYDKLTSKQIKYSLTILNQLVKNNNSIITKKDKNIEGEKVWFKVEIKRIKMVKKFSEYRILLLGDTKTGKSTFIANLIKNKLDKNGNGKNYTFNHKHELVSGETSSISYFQLSVDDNNYLFFDTPGNDKYIYTLLKIVQSIDYNLVLYFPSLEDNEWEYKKLFFDYFELQNIPIINLNLKSDSNDYPNINMNKLINKKDFINYVSPNFFKAEYNNELNFIVLNTYYNMELGFLLSGYLQSGTINKNDTLYWYINNKIKIKVISISNSNAKIDKVKGPKTITLRIKILDNKVDINIKNLKYGFVTNKKDINIINTIGVEWNKIIDNKNEIICNSENNKIVLKLQDSKYISCNNFNFRENLHNKLIINVSEKVIGKIIDL